MKQLPIEHDSATMIASYRHNNISFKMQLHRHLDSNYDSCIKQDMRRF